MDKEVKEQSSEAFNWNKHWYTEQQVMDVPLENKLDKLMDLTSPAAVNTAIEKMIEDWLIEELEASGVTVLETNEVS